MTESHTSDTFSNLFTGSDKLLAYYKGSCLGILCNSFLYTNLDDLTRKMINNGINQNITIKQQIQTYVEQLEIIKTNMIQKYPLTKDEESLWFLNIYALINLKILKNDDMNGFLLIKNQ